MTQWLCTGLNHQYLEVNLLQCESFQQMCSGVPLCGFKNHPDKTVALNHSLRKLFPGQAWCSGFTYIAVIKHLEQKQPEGEKGL